LHALFVKEELKTLSKKYSSSTMGHNKSYFCLGESSGETDLKIPKKFFLFALPLFQ